MANKERIKSKAVANPDKVNSLKQVARDHKDLKVVHKANKVRVDNKAPRVEETRTHQADNARVVSEATWKMKKVDQAEAAVKVEARADNREIEVDKVEARVEVKAEAWAEIKADLVHQAVKVWSAINDCSLKRIFTPSYQKGVKIFLLDQIQMKIYGKERNRFAATGRQQQIRKRCKEQATGRVR